MDYGLKELLALSEQAEPFCSLVDPDAPIFLNPEDVLKAIQSFCQQTGQPKPDSVGAIVRCCLESLALNYRTVIEDLETLLGNNLDIIRSVGGGSQNDLLSQFSADACQRRVIVGPVKATAIGNLLS
jgi:rhamnulokinase